MSLSIKPSPFVHPFTLKYTCLPLSVPLKDLTLFLLLSPPSFFCLTKSVVVVRQGGLCLSAALVWIHASVCTICVCSQLLISVCVIVLRVCMFKHAWAEPWGQSSFVLPTISQRWMCLQGIGPRRKAPPARSYSILLSKYNLPACFFSLFSLSFLERS